MREVEEESRQSLDVLRNRETPCGGKVSTPLSLGLALLRKGFWCLCKVLNSFAKLGALHAIGILTSVESLIYV